MGRLSAFLFSGLLSFSQAGAFELDEKDMQVGGYFDGGRFQLEDTSANGEVLNRLGVKWILRKEMNENWSLMANLHWMFWRNQATDLALFHIAGLKFDSDLEGAVTYHAGANHVKFGLYDFKYNPDSKNLGEYLLRSEAYPTIVENSQGKDLLSTSRSRVAGVQHDLQFDYFRQTALLYAEQFNVPVNDVSAAYLAAAGPRHAELEFGAAFHRMLKFGQPIKVEDLDPSLRAYVDSQGLTTRAVKLSLRGRLDFAAMFGMPGNFKVYGEAAMLGLKNDSLFYKEPFQRLPVMAGIELPTYGALDMLSAEVEYYKNPYYGRKYPISDATGSRFSPLPNLSADEYVDPRIPNITKDDLKWSLYLHKALNRWLDVKLRFASDHLRMLSWDGDLVNGEPMTKKPADWYFLARIEYHN